LQVESKLQDLGLVLPDAPKVPPGFKFSFAWTRVYDGRLYLSGHSAQAPDGSYIGPFGKVPSEVSLEEAQEAARNTALSMLASIKRELGELDRVRAWLMVSEELEGGFETAAMRSVPAQGKGSRLG
jgi:hypothetical protein